MDAAHPLAAPLARWRDQAGVRQLRLDNLPGAGVGRPWSPRCCTSDRTRRRAWPRRSTRTRGGNPYETVELLNALRRDGVLTATAGGWRWDAAAVRAHLGAVRAGRGCWRRGSRPCRRASRQMVEAMACLGGRAELSLLQTATGAAGGRGGAGAGARAGRGAAGGRARGAAGGAVPPRPDPRGGAGRAGSAAAARRCSWRWRGGWPGCRSCSRWRPSSTCRSSTRSTDAAERRQVVGLLRRAADQAGLIGDYALVSALLGAAVRLVDPAETGHAGRAAHRPARRAVQRGPPGRGRRGVPGDRRRWARPRRSARTRRRCRCAA